MISINKLRFAYPHSSQNPILDIPTWRLAEGQRLFLQGPSGCGKSTFLKLLSGRLRPQSGELNILGRNLGAMSNRQSDKFRAQNMGIVFQRFNLIPYLSPLENLALPQYFIRPKFSLFRKNNDGDAKDLLQTLGIPQSLWYYPVNKLSNGQQQRVAIARAMVNRPKIIIADEPTSALDERRSDNFMKLLMEYCENLGTALVFVSHDSRLAKYFNHHQQFKDFNHSSLV